MSDPTDVAASICDSATGLSALLCSMNLPFQPSYWIIQGVALSLTALLLPGLRITSIFGPLLMIAAIALVNAFLWDASLFFRLPKDVSTHAVLIAGWNAVIFWFLVKILPGIEIRGFVAPILAPIVFTVTTLYAGQYVTKVDWAEIATGVVSEVQEQRDLLRRPRPAERRASENRAPAPQPRSENPASSAKYRDFEKF